MNKRQRKKLKEDRFYEVIDLDSKLAQWFVPRLREFIDYPHRHPKEYSPEEWDSLLNEMLEGFTVLSHGRYRWSEEEQVKIDRAIDIFKTSYRYLWI